MTVIGNADRDESPTQTVTNKRVHPTGADARALSDHQVTKLSKYLSKHLRHQPERIGLRLDPAGWVPVHDLLRTCERQRVQLSAAELMEVVARNDKQRFELSDDRALIRAAQGHSVEVDLQLNASAPPSSLFHGTAQPTLTRILTDGLSPMGRRHVHLSTDARVAAQVGARHGPPVVLVIDSGSMARDDLPFWRAKNGVWLTASVPARYLRRY